MKIGIMQPYFFPYIGYFQLIDAVDQFVIYDDIEYTKKGWINRNRILLNGTDSLFSLPLKKGSDYLSVNERCLAENFEDYRKKFIGQLKAAYSKAPCFVQAFPIIDSCLQYKNHNLFDFVFNAVKRVCGYLEIETPFIVSSTLPGICQLKGEEKVIDISKMLNATTYINAIGGQVLYNRETFLNQGIDLKFIKSESIAYTQYKNEFVSNLSIIDVIMFNAPDKIRAYLQAYSLI